MPSYSDFLAALDHRLLDNSLRQWLIAAGVAASTLIALVIIRSLVARRLKASSDRFALRWLRIAAHLAERTRFTFILIVSLYIGSLVLVLPPKAAVIVHTVAVLALLLQAALWGHAFLTYAIDDYMQRRIQKDAASVTTVTAIGFLAKIVLWALVALVALDNVGVNVTALIAGLGIGGIAVALAAQNILGDLFASLSIVLDKPFVLGDAIMVGEFIGTVDHIGIRTTRVKSLSGEQLVFANSELLKSTVRNFKRLVDRRVLFTVDVTYDTPPAKLAAIPAMIRSAIEAQQPVRFDRAHFKALGPSSLIFEAVYYVQSPEYNVFMDAQQGVLLRLVEEFQRQQIEFAFPTQTIHLAPPSAQHDASPARLIS
jgi:small-conductance mechanosensitive channel